MTTVVLLFFDILFFYVDIQKRVWHGDEVTLRAINVPPGIELAGSWEAIRMLYVAG